MEEKDFAQESNSSSAAQNSADGQGAAAPKRRPRISESRFRDAGASYDASEASRPSYNNKRSDNGYQRDSYGRSDYQQRDDYSRPSNDGYGRPSNDGYQRPARNNDGYQSYQRPARPNTSYRRYDNTDSYQRPSTPNNSSYQRPDYNATSADSSAASTDDNAASSAQTQGNGGYQRPQNSYNQGGYNNNRGGGYGNQGGYNNNRGGGYGNQGGYNNNRGGGYGNQGGYNNNRGGGYGNQGGYNNNRGGGYGNQGGYNNNRGGGYGNQGGSYGNQGGYNNNRGGSYGNQGGYNNNRGGGYGNQGGYNNNRGGGFNNQGRGGFNNNRRPNNFNRNMGGYNPHAPVDYQDTIIDPNEELRLNKYLANAGVCSRREADDYITKGSVKVNGEVVTELGTKVTRKDVILFNDQPVSLERKIYVLLNKPKNCVTTSDDPQGRQTVMDLVRNAATERIYPVGRLDRNTTGVLLLTNDGDLASKLTHPKYIKKKIYHVWLDKDVTAEDMAKIAAGVELEDGPIHADAIAYANEEDRNQVGIEIHSGKNRIVRRIFEHLGYCVIKLDRVYFAGLTKKNLPRGRWRNLSQQEVSMLKMGAFE